jgi:hypothetical protein
MIFPFAMQRLVVVAGQSTCLLKAVELNSANPSHQLPYDEYGTAPKILLRPSRQGHRIYHDSNIAADEVLSTSEGSAGVIRGLSSR